MEQRMTVNLGLRSRRQTVGITFPSPTSCAGYLRPTVAPVFRSGEDHDRSGAVWLDHSGYPRPGAAVRCGGMASAVAGIMMTKMTPVIAQPTAHSIERTLAS